MRATIALCLATAAAAAPTAAAGAEPGDIATFLIPIPELGTEFFFSNDLIPDSNAFNGAVVIDARIDLVLDVIDTEPDDPRVSSAAFFASEVIVPVDFDPITPGNQFYNIITTGADEGWSGTGTFTVSRTLDELIGGTWVSPVFYTATTYDNISANEIVRGTVHPFEASFITITVQQVPAPSGAALLAGAGLMASRRRRR